MEKNNTENGLHKKKTIQWRDYTIQKRNYTKKNHIKKI